MGRGFIACGIQLPHDKHSSVQRWGTSKSPQMLRSQVTRHLRKNCKAIYFSLLWIRSVYKVFFSFMISLGQVFYHDCFHMIFLHELILGQVFIMVAFAWFFDKKNNLMQLDSYRKYLHVIIISYRVNTLFRVVVVQNLVMMKQNTPHKKR